MSRSPRLARRGATATPVERCFFRLVKRGAFASRRSTLATVFLASRNDARARRQGNHHRKPRRPSEGARARHLNLGARRLARADEAHGGERHARHARDVPERLEAAVREHAERRRLRERLLGQHDELARAHADRHERALHLSRCGDAGGGEEAVSALLDRTSFRGSSARRADSTFIPVCGEQYQDGRARGRQEGGSATRWSSLRL